MKVLVTGASQGIGLGIAQALADGGAHIALCASRHSERLDAASSDITSRGGTALSLVGDLGDPLVPGRLVEEAAAGFGGLDALVANAATMARPSPIVDMTAETIDRVFSVNVRATFLLARAAFPHLRASAGSLVTIGSLAGSRPHPGSGAYGASKAATAMLTRQLAQEWAPHGVRANCISPGYVLTPRSQPVYDDPSLGQARRTLVPLRQIGEPGDIAAAVLFLICDEAKYCTGQELLVDGGLGDALLGLDPGNSVYQNQDLVE